MANHVRAHRSVIFYLLSVFPSHLRLLNGQAKVRYCHNAVAMFRGVRGSIYRPYLCTDYRHARTRDRARHVASRRICPHIHVLVKCWTLGGERERVRVYIYVIHVHTRSSCASAEAHRAAYRARLLSRSLWFRRLRLLSISSGVSLARLSRSCCLRRSSLV